MKHRWQDISAGENIPETINVLVEVPVGSVEKYELDKVTDIISIDRTNNNLTPFPFAYGFIPQTFWADGDPLDVVLLTNNNFSSGSLVEARPVAVVEMSDDNKSDDKIIAVPKDEIGWEKIQNLNDIGEPKIQEIINFFKTYKPINNGKAIEVKIGQIKERTEALKAIDEGIRLYKEKFNR